MQTKNIVIGLLVLSLIGAVGFLLLRESGDNVVIVTENAIPDSEATPVESDNGISDGAESLDELVAAERGDTTAIGESVDGNDIIAYHFGEGETEILLIGGVHGAYSPNTTDLGREFIDYFESNGDAIPDNVTLTIIPLVNPDGLKMSDNVEGRFNANDVDLNRNFACDWSATSKWREREVSGGKEAFSEPEATAVRDYVEANNIQAAVVWFSAEGKVYPSACGGNPDKDSVTLAATFATAAGYPAEAEFDAYQINGDMVNWMAKMGIPAISVLLTDHKNTEWSKNLAGVEAVLKNYAE